MQFCEFMLAVTDMSRSRIYMVFDMLDVDASGEIEFDEFYLLVCILISNQVMMLAPIATNYDETLFKYDIQLKHKSNTVLLIYDGDDLEVKLSKSYF